MNLFHFFQAAHPVGLLGAQQVALAGMHSHHFSGRRNLKPFGGTAMRLELELLYLFSHEHYLSEILPSRAGFPGCGRSSLFCHSERSEESLFDLTP